MLMTNSGLGARVILILITLMIVNSTADRASSYKTVRHVLHILLCSFIKLKLSWLVPNCFLIVSCLFIHLTRSCSEVDYTIRLLENTNSHILAANIPDGQGSVVAKADKSITPSLDYRQHGMSHYTYLYSLRYLCAFWHVCACTQVHSTIFWHCITPSLLMPCVWDITLTELLAKPFSGVRITCKRISTDYSIFHNCPPTEKLPFLSRVTCSLFILQLHFYYEDFDKSQSLSVFHIIEI